MSTLSGASDLLEWGMPLYWSWISTRISPDSQGRNQNTAPHWQGCMTWEPELVGALLEMRMDGWTLWLSVPHPVAMPLVHMRSIFAHCLPWQELHCDVKPTINKRCEKQIPNIFWKLLCFQKLCQGNEKERLFIWMMFTYLYLYLKVCH